SAAESPGQTQTLLVEQQVPRRRIIERDRLVGGRRSRGAHAVERGEDRRIAGRASGGRFEMAFCIGEIATPEREKGETLEGTGVIAVAFECGVPRRTRPFVVALVGAHPT